MRHYLRIGAGALDTVAFEELVFHATCIDAERARETKDKMVAAAFVAYQLSGNKKTFGEHLRSLGLMEPEKPITKEERHQMAQDALSRVQRILKADKGKGKKR